MSFSHLPTIPTDCWLSSPLSPTTVPRSISNSIQRNASCTPAILAGAVEPSDSVKQRRSFRPPTHRRHPQHAAATNRCRIITVRLRTSVAAKRHTDVTYDRPSFFNVHGINLRQISQSKKIFCCSRHPPQHWQIHRIQRLLSRQVRSPQSSHICSPRQKTV